MGDAEVAGEIEKIMLNAAELILNGSGKLTRQAGYELIFVFILFNLF